MTTPISNLESVQIALMYQTPFLGSFEGVLDSVKQKITIDRHQLIPIPSEAPGEIPRLEVFFGSSSRNIQFAKNRADIIFREKEPTDDEIEIFFDIVIELVGVPIGRIGYVKKTLYTEKVDEEFVRKNVKVSISEIGALEDIQDALWRFNKKTLIGDIVCNNITVRTLLREETTNSPAILLERDVNTLQTSNLNIGSSSRDNLQEKIKKIVESLKTEAEKLPLEVR